MIGRVWHGWTTLEDAAEYEQLLREEIFPAIAAKGVAGYRGVQMFRRDCDAEAEFMTLMLFDSFEAVREFAGKEYERAYVPAEARAILVRFHDQSAHYELRKQYP